MSTVRDGWTPSVLQLYQTLARRLEIAQDASLTFDISYRSAIQQGQEFLGYWYKAGGPHQALLHGSRPVDGRGERIWGLLNQANDVFTHLECKMGIPQHILPSWKPVADKSEARPDGASAFTHILNELKWIDSPSPLNNRPETSTHSPPSTTASDTPLPSSPLLSSSVSPATRLINRVSPTLLDEAPVWIKQEQHPDDMEIESHERSHGRKDSHLTLSASKDQHLEPQLPSIRDTLGDFSGSPLPPYPEQTISQAFAAESPSPQTFRETPFQPPFTEVPLPHVYTSKILPPPSTPRMNSNGGPMSPLTSVISTSSFHSPRSIEARADTDHNGALDGTHDTIAMTAMTAKDPRVFHPPMTFGPDSDFTNRFRPDSNYTDRFRPESSYRSSSSSRHPAPS